MTDAERDEVITMLPLSDPGPMRSRLTAKQRKARGALDRLLVFQMVRTAYALGRSRELMRAFGLPGRRNVTKRELRDARREVEQLMETR